MLPPVTGEARLLRKVPDLPSGTAVPLNHRPGYQLNQQKPVPREHTSLPPTQQFRFKPLNRRVFRYTEFARQLARQPAATGAIAPSSRSLAKRVVWQADLHDAKTVVELGSGTGVFTEEILNTLTAEQKFFAIELNKTFVTATRNRCPDACVYHSAATELPVWLTKAGSQHADCVISSLPWTIFDVADQDELMRVISSSLAPDGVFVAIVYLGAKYRSRGRYFINNLQRHFATVTTTPTVWRNLPPTQIYRCVK